jgi:hypothetical protein
MEVRPCGAAYFSLSTASSGLFSRKNSGHPKYCLNSGRLTTMSFKTFSIPLSGT